MTRTATPAATFAARATITLKVTALALLFLVGLPVQWLSMKLGGTVQRRLPVVFHRSVCRVLGLRARIEGPPASGAVLIVANHSSWLDIILLGSLMPLSFVAKSEVGKWPFFGGLARLQNTVFVDRQKKVATASASAAIGHRLARGETMVLFAEGTTSDGGRVLPFRSALIGAARAALGVQLETVIIQPVSVVYTHRHGLPLGKADRPFLSWYGDMDLLPHLTAILSGGPIDAAVTFGGGIVYGPGSDRKAVAAQAEASVRRAVQRAVTGRAAYDPAREAAKED